MPLAFPSVGIQSINMRLRRTVAVSESPFTYDQQVYEHSGARWEAEISLPPLTYAEARSVEAFIVGLKRPFWHVYVRPSTAHKYSNQYNIWHNSG